ncbi:Ion channel [Clostridium aceticum]|uniref:Ion channel n=1 Tax=Clostridium aceticum TaxID=84022 RepID=A0A0D8IEF6_9CLOT|nr:potassium channel family protein [Clostridium aceticum]AKL94208.1 Ion channel [Clostridium aceticum]KJF28454.1 hypothetical protein TZ02_00535 [Clostridium aceticum]
MDILKRVLVLLVIYVVIVILNILSFAYLYIEHDSLVDTNGIITHSQNYKKPSLSDAIYFSGVTYLTIGYGDITAVNKVGKLLTVLQGFSGVLINSLFTGMFLYYLVKRPKNIIITNKVYIKYEEDEDKFYLSVRVGNKGRALVNVNRVLEVFVYEDNIRKRKLHLSQEYYYFEKLLYWNIDLQEEKNLQLLNYLKSSLFDNESVLIRISVIGTDVEAGELVFISRHYTGRCIQFIRNYVDLYQWQHHRRSNINWRDFHKTFCLEEEKIEKFKDL